MRLIGYSLRRRPFFNRGLYLPLGELTVLLGANDAGKSTLLRALAADLGGRPLNELEGEGFALYFSVEDRELPLLSNTRPASAADRGIFDLWSHGGYDAQRAGARDEDEKTMQAHLRALRDAATSEGFDRVIEALASYAHRLRPPADVRARAQLARLLVPASSRGPPFRRPRGA